MTVSYSEYKSACAQYAEKVGIELPQGFLAHTEVYGPAARELTKRIQEINKIKADGSITPETLSIINGTTPTLETPSLAIGAAPSVSTHLKSLIEIVVLFDCLVVILTITILLLSLFIDTVF